MTDIREYCNYVLEDYRNVDKDVSENLIAVAPVLAKMVLAAKTWCEQATLEAMEMPLYLMDAKNERLRCLAECSQAMQMVLDEAEAIPPHLVKVSDAAREAGERVYGRGLIILPADDEAESGK